MIKVKLGVRPRMLNIAAAAANTAQAGGFEVVITSGMEGAHSSESKHYTLEALDIRRSNLTPGQLSYLMAGIAARLGDDYDVVLESDHIHVEYDPA